MPLQATSGAASYDAFGGGVVAEPNYIESCFSTYLYTGNGSTQTVTNSIDLSTYTGLVWLKNRTSSASSHIFPTKATGQYYSSNNTGVRGNNSALSFSWNSNGFNFTNSSLSLNQSGQNYTSWTFRQQAKFFDVVTYTGDGTSNKSVAHNLNSVPGCVIIKCTSLTGTSWQVWHRGSDTLISTGGITGLQLDLTDAGYTTYNYGASLNIMAAQPTSTNIYIKNPSFDASACNASGETYVAYIYAHNAGGFGLTGTDNVISCGSYVGNLSTSGPVVTLGYEPQLLLIKNTTNASDWFMLDTMRGLPVSGSQAVLAPNNSDAEYQNAYTGVALTATGFKLTLADTTLNESGSTYIYIAIRRGPMKVPTSGTSVFKPVAYTGTNVGNRNLTGFGFPLDLSFIIDRDKGGFNYGSLVYDRLRGLPYLITSATDAEGTTNPDSTYGVSSLAAMDGVIFGSNSGAGGLNTSADFGGIVWGFRRAPSVFDVVCYTGNGVNSRMVTHNLGVQPELLIIKRRDASLAWSVAGKIVGGFKIDAFLNTTAAFASGSPLDLSAEITSTAFQPQVVGNYARALNTSGGTYVAYLFATCAGVSKVSSYTGTGTTQQVNCGFTAGARFVLIKRTDDTSDWYVWDTARGIVSGNDPYLLLNSTAAETTTTDYIDTYSAGFELSSTAPSAINASGGTFIFLAIA